MKRYFLSIGSNVNPQSNVPRILLELLQLSPKLDVSRIVETAPVGLVRGESFLNCVVCFYSTCELSEQKLKFNEIEIKLGRDRSHARSKQKNRTADIDILFVLGERENPVNPELLPRESYVRPMLLELLDFLHIDCRAEKSDRRKGVAIQLEAVTVGQSATTIHMNGAPNSIEILRA
ncbi:MAG: 2-amino-4-hydroxy-6-hydroxymethyldihydropteridine diphosphokinase [Calditrichaeota bacterium]|nr:2-amino-4-hydroxy-6-hydroxymethyldihydropteridine diphosphokinase [Calditrichota bacterium]